MPEFEKADYVIAAVLFMFSAYMVFHILLAMTRLGN